MTQTTAEIRFSNTNVSRETEQRLRSLVALVIKWNATINLVAKSTIDQIWERHIVDSIQIFDFGASARHWVDLGSGGGFPGLVIAALATEKAPHMQVTLVESDQRKAAFLRQASQTLGLTTKVVADRIEALLPLSADVVSARALAPLPKLCGFAARHLAPDGVGIFQKGKTSETEIAEARKDWHFSFGRHQSLTDPSAVVLVLKEIAHV